MSVRGPRKNNSEWESTEAGGYRKKSLAANAHDTKYDTLRSTDPWGDSLEDDPGFGYDAAIGDMEDEFGDISDLDDYALHDDDYDDYNPQADLAELGLDFGSKDPMWD